MCTIKVPQQQDTHSCGVIVLHAIENILKFAYSWRFAPGKLYFMSAVDLNYDDIIESVQTYRVSVGAFFNVLMQSAPRFELVCQQEFDSHSQGYSGKCNEIELRCDDM